MLACVRVFSDVGIVISSNERAFVVCVGDAVRVYAWGTMRHLIGVVFKEKMSARGFKVIQTVNAPQTLGRGAPAVFFCCFVCEFELYWLSLPVVSSCYDGTAVPIALDTQVFVIVFFFNSERAVSFTDSLHSSNTC